MIESNKTRSDVGPVEGSPALRSVNRTEGKGGEMRWAGLLNLILTFGMAGGLVCCQRPGKRVAWNERLVTLIDEANDAVTRFRQDYFSEFDKGDTDYDALQGMASSTLQRIGAVARELEALEPIKGGEETLRLARELMTLLQLFLVNARDLAGAPRERPYNSEKFTALATDMDDLLARIETANKRLRKAQEAMARSHGFALSDR